MTNRHSNRNLLWLALAIVLAVLPQFQSAPLWIPIACLLLVGWRLLLAYGRNHIPLQGTWIAGLARNLLALGLVLGVYLTFGTLFGRDAGVALLVVLTGFKFLESRWIRDHYVVVSLGLFLILTNFFYSQTVFTAAYMFLVVLMLIATLIDLNDPRARIKPAGKLRGAGQLLGQALPIMLIAFLLFPRVPGPLWGMPDDAHGGVTGLDDEMMPGTISQLSLSNDVAFRVEFSGRIPEQSQLYWRGPVLWDTNGRKWTRGQSRVQGLADIKSEGPSLDYTITIEPHNRNWIFALEMPIEIPGDTRMTRDFQLLAGKPIRQRVRYDLTAYPHYRTVGADQIDFERALALPPDQHPRSVELARSWRAKGLDSKGIIDRALSMFHNETFYYTLSPPLLTGDAVDEFLFDTREGFCEHYAAAFAVLMRAAGIPARIVTGYQGGTMNPIGNYLIVRQYDAHAWVEVWLGEAGWQRVDPTAAVSPARIRDGITTALPDSLIDVPLGLQEGSLAAQVLRHLRNRWDAFNNQWNQWVLGYTQQRQRDLLGRFGIDTDWRELTLWLTGAVMAVFTITAAWLLLRRRETSDAARRIYDRFCRKLARAGIVRRSYEGPRDFAHRASQKLVSKADVIQRITHLYIRTRYGATGGDLEQLQRAVRGFRIS